ncbi:universal stress protein [Asanoa sp. NPDC049518]|uniref:universal stress protein n=1 Tax=unclassified Asanoa TaxID=2685164 RepID=UPI00343FCEEF
MPTRVLVGYDGSPAASGAIDAAALLFPDARAWITYLWAPPFASTSLRQRLWSGSSRVDEFVQAVEREGTREAERTAAMGVTLARAAGWEAEPLVVRSYGGEGLQLAALAEERHADLVLVGSRGLGGAEAVLGSVSDMVVHHAPVPVLVVPHPLLTAEFAALDKGPVVVGVDDSDGARAAHETAARLFPTRALLPVTVDEGRGRAVAGALAACGRDQAAAALVVGSRGRSALREIMLGSVAMATLHHAYRPVLVAPSPPPVAR